MDKKTLECSIRRCYSTWGERYYADYYQGDGAYPPVHTHLIRGLLHQIDAKSILGLMALGAAQGTQVSIACEGSDEEEAIEAVTELILQRFGEVS